MAHKKPVYLEPGDWIVVDILLRKACTQETLGVEYADKIKASLYSRRGG